MKGLNNARVALFFSTWLEWHLLWLFGVFFLVLVNCHQVLSLHGWLSFLWRTEKCLLLITNQSACKQLCKSSVSKQFQLPAKLHCPFKLEIGNLIAIPVLNQSEFITNWIRSSLQAQMKISKQLLDQVKMKVKKTRSNSCNHPSKINLSAIKQITAMLKAFSR